MPVSRGSARACVGFRRRRGSPVPVRDSRRRGGLIPSPSRGARGSPLAACHTDAAADRLSRGRTRALWLWMPPRTGSCHSRRRWRVGNRSGYQAAQVVRCRTPTPRPRSRKWRLLLRPCSPRSSGSLGLGRPSALCHDTVRRSAWLSAQGPGHYGHSQYSGCRLKYACNAYCEPKIEAAPSRNECPTGSPTPTVRRLRKVMAPHVSRAVRRPDPVKEVATPVGAGPGCETATRPAAIASRPLRPGPARRCLSGPPDATPESTAVARGTRCTGPSSARRAMWAWRCDRVWGRDGVAELLREAGRASPRSAVRLPWRFA